MATKQIAYKTHGTCASEIVVSVEDGIIKSCRFIGGCSGNTTGISKLVEGMSAKQAIERLSGIRCGFKATSCPDQLAKALESIEE